LRQATPEQAVKDKPKSAPVASVAEAAARGQIHVKTSGLTSTRKSEVAMTSQRVDFSMAQGRAARWARPSTRRRACWYWIGQWN